MEQIIGNHREFVVVERKILDILSKQADLLNEMDDTYSSIRANEIRYVVNFIKENNIYNKDFKIKS